MVTLFQTLHTLSYIAADRVSDRLKELKEKETGASAVEYALLVGLIAAALVAVLIGLRGRIQRTFESILP